MVGMWHPRARRDGLLIEPLADDLVVLDTVDQVAHSLSAPAAAAWRLADGSRSVAAIAAELGWEPETALRVVHELETRGLLVGNEITRRDAARRLAWAGGTAFAAPLVYSALIGPAMAAASTPCTNPGTCTTDGACCAGYWCNETQHSCVQKLANGATIPNDPMHTNPLLTGQCTVQAGLTVCQSGVCDSADNKCGYAAGDGPCTTANGAAVCRSGSCGAGVCN